MAFLKKVTRFARKAKVGKTYKKVSTMAKSRYGGAGGRSNIAKDVAMLKALVNVEKKRVDSTQNTALAVAQTAGAGFSGATCTQITPVVAQGITNSTRNGNSVKLVSCLLSIQFAQQANTVNDMKLKWFIICRPDNAALYAPSAIVQQFLEVNPFSTVQDYYSNRDPEYFTAFRVIKQGVVDLKQDQVTSGQSIVQKTIPLRLNHHLKFNSNTSTDTTKNAFYLLVTASSGDSVALTGASFAYNVRWYYTDN